ncbi:fosfomycin resistance glutathione transferase [Undibacterium sp. Di26W]|uniref:fosfomycin resistance glutathione transferase n=1 Tax=Undibacterium sp. Di26W TaxID=3413035 RepID=UPI003BF43B46
MTDIGKPGPGVSGLNHLTLSVTNLERSFTFYVDVLGLKPVARWQNGAYLLAGDDWICLSVDSECRTHIPAEYTHTAFSVSPEAYTAFAQKADAGELQPWKSNKSEGDSLYLLDPDGHKLELHVGDLESRLASLRNKPYAGLILY